MSGVDVLGRRQRRVSAECARVDAEVPSLDVITKQRTGETQLAAARERVFVFRPGDRIAVAEKVRLFRNIAVEKRAAGLSLEQRLATADTDGLRGGIRCGVHAQLRKHWYSTNIRDEIHCGLAAGRIRQ